MPTSDPNVALNVQAIVDRARMSQARAMLGNDPATTIDQTRELALRTPMPRIIRVLLFGMDHRVLPFSWLFGFLFTYATTQIRSCYLLGAVRLTGWWYYFPCAMLFKTPTATLAAIVAIPAGIFWTRKSILRNAPTRPRVARFSSFWAVSCLTIPAVVYTASAMSANLNLGLRHILPVYPFIFIGLGCGLSKVLQRHRQAGVMLAVILFCGLAGESLAAYPDYLPFFNVLSGGAAGGVTKLGDSNLDWGQDLKGLAEWQSAHRELPMYLSYFGTAEPAYYDVRAFNTPYSAGGWPFEPNPQVPQPPCYFAISVTNLQGIYIDGTMFDPLRAAEPVAIIGKSIYVYKLPLTVR